LARAGVNEDGGEWPDDWRFGWLKVIGSCQIGKEGA
jgi:hypothetical protein